MHMDDLPVEVHDKIDQVLEILGQPESLLVVKPTMTDTHKMDEESKNWFNDFLVAAPELVSDSSEDDDRSFVIGDNSDISEGSNLSLNSTKPSRRQFRSSKSKELRMEVKRRKFKNALIGDITPSNIALQDETSCSERLEGSTMCDAQLQEPAGELQTISSDSALDVQETMPCVNQEDCDSSALVVAGQAAEVNEGGRSRRDSLSAGLAMIKTTMAPLMSWIAQGKKQRATTEKSKMLKLNVPEGTGVAGEFPKRKSLDQIVPVKGDIDKPTRAAKTFKKDRKNRKAPQFLEICLPEIHSMKGDPVEPVQKFFERHQFDAWEFDVFELDRLTRGHSLWFLGMILFEHYKIVEIFQIKSSTLSSFLLFLEDTYCKDNIANNPYHNHIHAADVLQTTAHFSTTGPVQKRLRVIHGFALFVAAMGHDYKHPGRTNAFLINMQDSLALTYNDISVLENFHAAELCKLLVRKEFNILSGMDNKELRAFRSMVVKVILATDLASGKPVASSANIIGVYRSNCTRASSLSLNLTISNRRSRTSKNRI